MSGIEIDLHAELHAANGALTARHRERLAQLGFDRAADLCAGGIGLACVQIERGLFVPAVSGTVELIWPIWTGPISRIGWCEGELVDLLAWHPARPEQLLRRTGLGVALGMAAIERVGVDSAGALKLFRTPFAWAAAGGDAGGAAMILEWQTDNGLFGVAKLVCEDAEHADDVEHRLELLQLRLVPRLPQIQFNNPNVRTA